MFLLNIRSKIKLIYIFKQINNFLIKWTEHRLGLPDS